MYCISNNHLKLTNSLKKHTSTAESHIREQQMDEDIKCYCKVIWLNMEKSSLCAWGKNDELLCINLDVDFFTQYNLIVEFLA